MNILVWDRDLLILINKVWTNSYFDQWLPVMTDLHKFIIFWPVCVLIILAVGYSQWKFKILAILFLLLVTVGLTDFITSHMLKKSFERARPNTQWSDIQLKTHVHSGSSFPSNHAANMFAFATFMTIFLPRLRWLCFGLAALVAYSRVYVGVHYPTDVIAGALTGIAVALATATIAKNFSFFKMNKVEKKI